MIGDSFECSEVLSQMPGGSVKEDIEHGCLPLLNVLLGEGAEEREDPDRSPLSPVAGQTLKLLVAVAREATSMEETRV